MPNNEYDTILVESLSGTKRRIQLSRVARQTSVYLSQNVKKHKVHALALNKESIHVKFLE